MDASVEGTLGPQIGVTPQSHQSYLPAAGVLYAGVDLQVL